ncbi:competence type IV pilus ATPase ComGA [Marinilactibacillus kalidii]|uniref:competence type IV pilus ATPase ComGA n=1 Tax=Marinilactibacillus kalidii TaxID=2820274 RepID=UPI001ABDD9E1|nr:competence type IV pilus ATPase ComGA [Marinilactibacillus kalidii]
MEIESFVQHMLTLADSFDTSDIHILPEESHYAAYYRLHGRMDRQFVLDREEANRLIAYFKFVSNMDVGERRKPQSGSLSYQLKDQIIDLRFSTISNYHAHESLVIRLLKQKNQKDLTMNAFFDHEVKELNRLVSHKSGLILFSGPVDSGKTTTIYQLIKKRLSVEKLQVVTVEDPVEIHEEQFLQTEVNEKAGITYERLLKSSLRHHPDVLIVGEIRDEETAKMVIRGALTGHLMIASIHAKDANGVIPRMMELGISLELLKQTLIGIVFQKLLPLYCPLCIGHCHTFCHNYRHSQKRAVLFEMIMKENLEEVFIQDKPFVAESSVSVKRRFNHLLKKVQLYGYISEKTYQQYLIP